MVDHTTRIIISLKEFEQLRKAVLGPAPDAHSLRKYGALAAAAAERMAAMLEVLAAAGFTLKATKDTIYADSETVEATAAKRLLAARGFADKEYEIYLEYRRQWGIM